MADLTVRVSAAEYRVMLGVKSPPAAAARRPKARGKYGNVETNGFDSKKEAETFALLEMARQAIDPSLRVVKIDRQQRFLVIDKQDGERAAHYLADFVVTYADARIEVMDTKSVITRINPVYVLKRKLMLARYGIRIREV